MRQRDGTKWFVSGQVYGQENSFKDFCLEHVCPKGSDLREVLEWKSRDKYRSHKEEKNKLQKRD